MKDFRVALSLLIGIILASIPRSAESAIITGSASLYSNLFSGASTSVSGTGITVGASLSNAVDSGVSAARILGDTTNNAGTMTWDRGSGNATTVGTIVALHQLLAASPGGFLGPMPVNIRLDGNTVLTYAGANDAVQRYQIATLPQGTTAQKLEANFPNMPTYNGQQPTTFGDINELIAVTDRLSPIPAVTAGWSTSPTHAIGFGGFSNLVNKDGSDYVYDGTLGAWYVNPSYTNRYFDIDLGTVGTNELYDVSALLLSVRGDHAQDFNILSSTDGTNFLPIGAGVNVTTSNVAGQNEFFMINFNSSFSASHLRFAFADPQPDANNFAHLLEFVAFEDVPFAGVPEPSSLVLLVLGACGLFGCRRRVCKR